MYQYLGLIVAVEHYHDPAVPQVKYAKDDAIEFRNSLLALGCLEDRLELIVDDRATKTTIIEKVKEISKMATATDVLIFYFAGHGYFFNEENVLACVDSSPRSIKETTVNLKFILGAFEKAKSSKVISFLDCCHSGLEFSETERGALSAFSIDELRFFDSAEHLVVFSSCKSREKSHTDIHRKHGVWSYYLLQALQGTAAKEIYDGEFLFSGKLQRYLLENTRDRVKEITTSKIIQTPMKFGKESTDFIVADLTKNIEERRAKIKTEGVKFERATILTTQSDWVSNLPGFNKAAGNKPPKSIDSYHENWIKLISQKLIEEELNEIGDHLKSKLKYKRKDVPTPVVENGWGELSTPDFDYVIQITQSKERADYYILTRSIENFSNSEILTNPEFNEVFKNKFDQIEFTLSEELNVEEVIDKIEEIDNEDLISVYYERTDPSKCTVSLKDLAGTIELTDKTCKINFNRKSAPEQLVLQFKKVYEALEMQDIPKLLL